MRFPIAVAGLLLFAQDLRFHEKIEVRLIEVNAVVTDREGHRVYGLTADDFEIYEGRAKQAITNFSEYRTEPAPVPAVKSDIPAAEPVPQRAREPHSLLILVDALPQVNSIRQKTFEQVDDLLSKIVRSGDHVALIYWEPDYKRTTKIIESDDSAAVMQALRNFAVTMKSDSGSTDASTSADDHSGVYDQVQKGTVGKGSPIDFAAHKAASKQFEAEDRLMVLHKKCEGIRRLLDALGTRPGKKTVLYVSNSFRLEGVDRDYVRAQKYIDEITRSANANGITFYAVHPELVDVPANAAAALMPLLPDPEDVIRSTAALQRMTDPTGGLLGTSRMAVADLASMIAEDLESYYSLAYKANTDGGDRVRNISVKTKNPAYRVRTRTAVVEKSPGTIAREAVVSRLFVDEGANDVRFSVREGELKRTSGNRWLLPVSVQIPISQLQFAEERGEKIAHAGVLIACANGVTEVTSVTENELSIKDPRDPNGFVTYDVEILGDKRGSKVSIGVVDRRTGAIGVRTIDNRNRFH